MDYIQELNDLNEIYHEALKQANDGLMKSYTTLVVFMRDFLKHHDAVSEISQKIDVLKNKLSCEDRVNEIMGKCCDEEDEDDE